MDLFFFVFEKGGDALKVQWHLMGFTFSWWEIMLATMVFSMIAWGVFYTFFSD